ADAPRTDRPAGKAERRLAHNSIVRPAVTGTLDGFHEIGRVDVGSVAHRSPSLNPLRRSAAAIICVPMTLTARHIPLDSARVLVTGGAGFIGSYLIPSLTQVGAEVLVIDDLSRGRREHLRGLEGEGLHLHVGDIRDPETVRIAREFDPHACFHLAAIHFIPYCVAHPQETLEVNVLGFDRLLRA